MSTPIYKLEIAKDYEDLPLLRQKEEYLIIAFVKKGFQNADLKALNYARKFLKAVTLADIATADGSRISIQAYDIIVGNGLRTGIKEWPKTPTKDEIPAYFITVWQSAINKCLIIKFSSQAFDHQRRATRRMVGSRHQVQMDIVFRSQRITYL